MENFDCCICLGLLEEPVETPCCHHLGCSDCFESLDICPLCRAPMHFADCTQSVALCRIMERMKTESSTVRDMARTLRVTELKEICRQMHLKVSGRKDELVSRLMAKDAEELRSAILCLREESKSKKIAQQKAMEQDSGHEFKLCIEAETQLCSSCGKLETRVYCSKCSACRVCCTEAQRCNGLERPPGSHHFIRVHRKERCRNCGESEYLATCRSCGSCRKCITSDTPCQKRHSFTKLRDEEELCIRCGAFEGGVFCTGCTMCQSCVQQRESKAGARRSCHRPTPLEHAFTAVVGQSQLCPRCGRWEDTALCSKCGSCRKCPSSCERAHNFQLVSRDQRCRSCGQVETRSVCLDCQWCRGCGRRHLKQCHPRGNHPSHHAFVSTRERTRCSICGDTEKRASCSKCNCCRDCCNRTCRPERARSKKRKRSMGSTPPVINEPCMYKTKNSEGQSLASAFSSSRDYLMSLVIPAPEQDGFN